MLENKENEPDAIISIDAVRDFLTRHNEKVKQSDLIDHFRQQLSSPATKGVWISFIWFENKLNFDFGIVF